MLDNRALVNDLDEVYYVLVLCLANVIVDLEELFDVLELCIVLYEALEDALVLLVCDANEILSFEDGCDLRVVLRRQDAVNRSC